MWYAATITTPAAAEPVSLAEAKAHVRVDHSDDDTLLGVVIAAARAHIEKYCGQRFAGQTLTAKCDDFADFARLEDGPINSITSVVYLDENGDSQTLSTDVYELRVDGIEAAIVLKYNQTWPVIRLGSQITVVMAAGHASAPADVKAAMLLLIGHLYEHREAVAMGETLAVLPMGVDALLCNHRRGV